MLSIVVALSIVAVLGFSGNIFASVEPDLLNIKKALLVFPAKCLWYS
jgi:hypothetical protein